MANGNLTVKDLYLLCEEQIQKGNADKKVLISRDDEGNGFHGLFYCFTDDLEQIRAYESCFHDGNDPEEVVLLG